MFKFCLLRFYQRNEIINKTRASSDSLTIFQSSINVIYLVLSIRFPFNVLHCLHYNGIYFHNEFVSGLLIVKTDGAAENLKGAFIKFLFFITVSFNVQIKDLKRSFVWTPKSTIFTTWKCSECILYIYRALQVAIRARKKSDHIFNAVYFLIDLWSLWSIVWYD